MAADEKPKTPATAAEPKPLPLDQRISVTVAEAAAMSGLSRSSIYELINDGNLESRLVVGRRLITVRSLRRLIEGDPKE